MPTIESLADTETAAPDLAAAAVLAVALDLLEEEELELGLEDPVVEAAELEAAEEAGAEGVGIGAEEAPLIWA